MIFELSFVIFASHLTLVKVTAAKPNKAGMCFPHISRKLRQQPANRLEDKVK